MSVQEVPMKIGVVGARGRLGAITLRTLERLDAVDAIAIEALETLPDGLDAVINTAPLPNADLHQLALNSSCHVVDVTVDDRLIREMLALHSLARQKQRCLIAMAGLAPGLTGLLARNMLTSIPNAYKVQISLLQNSSGTAGRKGTLDMLNRLTDPMCIYKSRPYFHSLGKRLSTRRMFDFYTPELEFMAEANKIQFVTGFDNRIMNSAIAAMAVVRRLSPPMFRWICHTIADGKARTSEATAEEIELAAIVFNSEDTVIAERLIRLESDYGATATVACTAATLAVKGLPYTGAGHLCDFLELNAVLDHLVVQTQLL